MTILCKLDSLIKNLGLKLLGLRKFLIGLKKGS